MSYIKDLYESLADIVQGWKTSTVAIIMGVLAAVTFYNFAKFLKKNKADSTKFNSVGTLFTFLLFLGLIILFVSLLQY